MHARRSLLLLAILAAGFWHAAVPEPGTAARHEIAAAGDRAPGVLLRAAGPASSLIWYDGAEATPRAPVPRSSHRVALPEQVVGGALILAARHSAFEARSGFERSYGPTLTLARAGMFSFHTATPPPLPLI